MGAFRKESHAHRGRCAGSRTARDIAQTPSVRSFTEGLMYLFQLQEHFIISFVLVRIGHCIFHHRILKSSKASLFPR